jgi:hypothetical protein
VTDHFSPFVRWLPRRGQTGTTASASSGAELMIIQHGISGRRKITYNIEDCRAPAWSPRPSSVLRELEDGERSFA